MPAVCADSRESVAGEIFANWIRIAGRGGRTFVGCSITPDPAALPLPG